MSRLASEELAGIISRFLFTLTMAEEMSVLNLKTSAIEVMLSLSIPAKKDRLAFWPSRSISRTFFPLLEISQAELKQTEDLPAPPFSLMNVIVLLKMYSPFNKVFILNLSCFYINYILKNG